MKGGKGGGRGRGRGGRNSQARSDTHVDVVTKRVLSASRHKVTELVNQVEDLKRQMRVVVDENKLYKRMQHKQVYFLDIHCNQLSLIPIS